jgi:hypothetical protein
MSVRLRVALLVVPALLAAVRPAAAQRTLGVGDDAATLPTGRLRLSIGGLWDRANERYDADGKLRALGASASPWNGAYDPRLTTASALVTTLSGLSAFDASLGSLTIKRRDASTDALLGAEYGVLPWLTVGARVQVASHGIEPYVALNPMGNEGSMGLNPAWLNTAARDRNALLVSQFDSAIAQTSRRITTCQASPATAGCTPIVANVGGVQSLVTTATAFANALNSLYGGRKNAAGLPFVPVANGAAQLAINQRMLGYRDQFAALGNSAIGTTGPAAAALMSPTDLATVLTDSLYGYMLRPLRTVHAYGIGDISASVKLRVYQTVGNDTATIRGFALRQAVGVSLRLNGGASPEASEPFAPMTGSGSGGYSVQSFTDLFYGPRFAATVVLGLEQSLAQDYAARIPTASTPTVGGVPFPIVFADREVQLSRTPGSRVDIAVTPRVALTGNIWLGASWTYASQGADTWKTARLITPGEDVTAFGIDASAWAAATNWTEQRLVLGGTYSTVEAAHEGRARVAFDVTYQHVQTITGSGWRVPHLSRDLVTVRWYPHIWKRR